MSGVVELQARLSVGACGPRWGNLPLEMSETRQHLCQCIQKVCGVGFSVSQEL